MRFTEHLAAHLTPEWRTQYVQYEELRDYLTKAAEEAPSGDADGGQLRRHYFDDCDVIFFSFCVPESNKINNFFEEKLAEARRKFVALKSELMQYEEQTQRRTTVWQSLQMLASGSGDKKKMDRRTKRRRGHHREDVGYALKEAEDGEVVVKANGSGGKEVNSVISGLTRRISSANLQHVIQRTQARRQELRREKRQVRKLHEIKLAFSEFYLSLILLQNYQSLNFTGFRKILKKHDKLFFRTSGEEWRKAHIDSSFFHTNKEVDQLITKVETLYTRELEEGDRSRAMKRLRVPPLAQKLNPWTTFRAGYLFGLFSVQLLVIVLSILLLHPAPTVWEPAIRLYRGSFIVSLFVLLIGVNTYGWQLAGVNHVLIFEIDPRHHLTHQEFLEISGLLLNVWAISLTYFLFSPLLGTPAYAGPLVMVIVYTAYLFNPFRCLHYKARRWLLRILARIFSAPLPSVNFADFWLADQLNSLVVVFLDLFFFVCFYSCQVDWAGGLVPYAAANHSVQPGVVNGTRVDLAVRRGGVCATSIFGLVTLVRCLPAWFRFAQCLRRYYDMEQRAPFPHLVNAGKYSTTFFVAGFSLLYGTFFPGSKMCLALWLTCLIIGTIYTYAWDILMDWGLFDFNEVKCNARSVLRDQLVYHKTASYYFAIVEDLILRLSWLLEIILVHNGFVDAELVKCFLSLGEAFRRFVWNFFRLENEHLNNCGQFRAVRDIFISPITSTQAMERPLKGTHVGGTPRSQRSGAGSEGGSSSGVSSSCRKTKRLDCDASAHLLDRRAKGTVDTPQRYQPKGNRLFSSRTSLEMQVAWVNAESGKTEEEEEEGRIEEEEEQRPKFHLRLHNV